VGQHQQAEIAQRIAEVYQRSTAGVDWCLEMFAGPGENMWIQVVPTNVNTAWPLQTEPLATVDQLEIPRLAGLDLIDFQPGLFATYLFDETNFQAIAEFVDQLFLKVLGCDDDYALRFNLMEL